MYYLASMNYIYLSGLANHLNPAMMRSTFKKNRTPPTCNERLVSFLIRCPNAPPESAAVAIAALLSI